MRPRSRGDLTDLDTTTWHSYILHAVPCTVCEYADGVAAAEVHTRQEKTPSENPLPGKP